MSKWQMKRISEVAGLVTARVSPYAGTRRYISTGDVAGTEIVRSESWTFDMRPDRANLLATEGDVLFARMQATNKVVAVTRTHADCIWSTGFAALRPKSTISQAWLSLWLRSNLFAEQKDALCTGATQKAITNESILNLKIPLPPMADQERIVRILDEADALRRLRARAEERTVSLVQATFTRMFGDPAINPRGWAVLSVGDLITLSEYGTSTKASDTGEGIPVLRMNNITAQGQLDLSDLKSVELTNDDIAKYRLEAGDVLFNRTNSRELVGKTGMWDGRFDAVAASYFIRLRFDPALEHPQHFTTFMNLPDTKRRLFQMARGAVGQANINAQELRALALPKPPIELQREFAARVAEIRALEAAQAASRVRLDALFQSLLWRAFRGEL